MTHDKAQDWFDAAPDDKEEILVVLRNMIRDLDVRIVEEIKWSRPCYSINGKHFCYLYITRNHVTLGFQKGTSLKDPSNLLLGTGKEMRHINFLTLAEVDQTGILRIIEEAKNYSI